MLSMRDLNPGVRDKIITQFAQRIPNAERFSANYTKGLLTVWFDGIHERNYIISEILAEAVTRMNEALKGIK